MLTRTDAVSVGVVPPRMRDRYIVRCTEATFGASSKGNPMITLSWEIAGHPQTDGTISNEIVRDGKKYQIAGLRAGRTYLTLVPGPALNMFLDFQQAVGLPEEVDETNPDLSGYNGLVVSAIVEDDESKAMREATDEEKEAGKEGLVPILDEDGKEVTRRFAVVKQILKRYNGELNQPY